MIQWILVALVIIILLLGGWWILAIGLGLLAALVGAVLGSLMWLFDAVWPFLLAGIGAFTALGVLGLILQAAGIIDRKPKRRAPPPAERPLPPFRRPRPPRA